jgi:type IV pilus assembly protein PilC
MVRAGERTGNLVRPVEMLETYYRSATVLEARLRTALVYPGIILAVSALFLPLYAFAVSQYRCIFDSMNVELPAMTRLVLGFGPQWSLPFSAAILVALAALTASREARSLVLGWLPMLGRSCFSNRAAPSRSWPARWAAWRPATG